MNIINKARMQELAAVSWAKARRDSIEILEATSAVIPRFEEGLRDIWYQAFCIGYSSGGIAAMEMLKETLGGNSG